MHLDVERVLFASGLLYRVSSCEAVVSSERDTFSGGDRLPIAISRANLGGIVYNSRCSLIVEVILNANARELLRNAINEHATLHDFDSTTEGAQVVQLKSQTIGHTNRCGLVDSNIPILEII